MLISWFWSLYYDCVIILGFIKYKQLFRAKKHQVCNLNSSENKNVHICRLKENDNANLAKC